MMITTHWPASLAVLAACAVVAMVHLTGLLLIRGEAGSSASRGWGQLREAAIFYAGLLVAAAALVSPIGYWSGRYIWVRSIQDLLLAIAAPALIVLGAPWLALRRGVQATGLPGTRSIPDGARAVAASDGPATRWWLTRPALIAIAFNVAWCGWHLPALYDFALSSTLGYAAEVITYLAAGTALWLVLIGSAPISPRLTPLQRVTLVFGTVAVDTVLGMVLVFGSGLLYPSYRGGAHHVLSVVADQQVAGAVLWMGMLPTFIIAAVALLLRWLNDEESQALTSGLNRLLSPGRYTWPSGPGLK
jgi:putative membrane protein